MFVMSDSAVDKAKEVLEAEGKAGWGLRVFVAGGSCCGPSFGMDIDEKPGEGDEVVEKNGLKVFIDKQTSETLNGMKMDYVKDGEQKGFVIKGGQEPPEGGCAGCE